MQRTQQVGPKSDPHTLADTVVEGLAAVPAHLPHLGEARRGLFHGRSNLCIAELWHPEGVAWGEHSPGQMELDLVSPVSQFLAGGLADFVLAIYDDGQNTGITARACFHALRGSQVAVSPGLTEGLAGEE